MAQLCTVFSGRSNNADRVKQRAAVLEDDSLTKFDSDDSDFLETMDELREHLEDYRLERACIVRIQQAGGGTVEANVFDDFGTILPAQMIADRDARKQDFQNAEVLIAGNPLFENFHNITVAIYQ